MAGFLTTLQRTKQLLEEFAVFPIAKAAQALGFTKASYFFIIFHTTLTSQAHKVNRVGLFTLFS